MYTDSHCHLDPKTWGGDAEVDAVVQRAFDAGVDRMITIGSGYGADSGPRAHAVASRHERVWFAAGIHPHDASDWGPEAKAMIEACAQSPSFVAVGEMGLDFYYDNSPRDVQRACLREQAQLALRLAKPIIVHDRDSEGETLEVLKAEGAFDGAGVLWHCFTGDVPYMQQIVDAGGFISIPGIVTFKKAQTMRDVAAAVPADRFLIETDSPFLTPVPFRGKKNEPARVVHVAQKVAEVRGMTVEAVAALTNENTTSFFRL